MSLTVSQDEGTTIITITSNPKNKWPIFCQILGYLLCNPVCFVSEDMKLTDTQRALGIVQIIVAVMNLVLGCFGLPWASSVVTYGGLHIIVIVLSVLQLCVAIFFCVLTIKSLNKKGGSAKLVEDKTAESRSDSSLFGHSCNMTLTASQDMKKKMTDTHTALGIVQIIVGVMNITAGCFGFDSFWIGGVFLVVGILCVLAVKVPSRLLLVFLVILNIVSAALAVLAFVLFSAELTTGTRLNCDENHYRHHSSYNDFANGSLEGKTSIEICLYYKDLNQMILGGLEIMMIVLSFLQLFVTISFCVWTVKALFTLAEDAKAVEDPELYKPLLEEDTASAA